MTRGQINANIISCSTRVYGVLVRVGSEAHECAEVLLGCGGLMALETTDPNIVNYHATRQTMRDFGVTEH
jgi:hypothetical protein